MDLVTVKEAAQLVQMSESAIHHAIKRNAIRPVVVADKGGKGNGYRLLRSDVVALWIDPSESRTKKLRRRPQPKRPKRRVTCSICQSVFLIDDVPSIQRQYCSRACSGAAKRLLPDGMSLRAAAAILGVTYQSVWSYVKRGKLSDLKAETVLAFHRARSVRKERERLQRLYLQGED